MDKPDYYDVLGVPKGANKDEIKAAYRKLALQFHPDRNKSPDATERFKEISEAYAILSDDEKRGQYDQFGRAGIYERYNPEDIFRGADFDSIFRDIGGFGGIFEQLLRGFGGFGFQGFAGPQRPSRGEDLVYDLGDIVGRFSVEVYALDAEVLHVLVECLRVPGGEPERIFAGLSRSVDDPIIDVGDVEDKEDAVSYSPEITGNYVIVNVSLGVADMAGVIDCGPTYEHVDSPRMDGPELVQAPGQRVVDSQPRLSGSCHACIRPGLFC